MKDLAGTAMMLALTTAVAIGCYGATAHGVALRTEVESLERQLAAEARRVRNLEAELHTRARMPLIERWNERALKMSAPATGQFMGSAVQLVSLVSPPPPAAATPPAAPAPQLALALAEAPAPAVLVRAAYPAPAATPSSPED